MMKYEVTSDMGKSLRWDQQFTCFIIGIIVALLFYRIFHEIVTPILLTTSMTNSIGSGPFRHVIVWASTLVLTIIIVELLKRMFLRREKSK